MKIIVAPDKFKGSLSSIQACQSIAAGIAQFDKKATVLQFPMADGGDGFAAVLQHYLNTQSIECNAEDPLMRPIKTAYQWDVSSRLAIIELAVASGLQHLKEKEKNPLFTSTFGTGLQIKDAIEKGAKTIMLGIGGSATNDAGIGILAALGFDFLDAAGHKLSPVGKSLSLIQKIKVPVQLPKIHFTIAVDVQNILFGESGAARVYAAQKGANESTVKLLNKGLQHFAKLVHAQTGKDIASIAGTGAAGGVAAGLMSYFDVEMIKGSSLVMEISTMEKQVKNADLIITGEGKLDNQSSYGKVVSEVANLGKLYNVPVIALCGLVDINEQQIKEMGLQFANAIKDNTISTATAIAAAGKLLTEKAAKAIPQFLELNKLTRL
jgi:glycerate kinase